MSRQGTSHLCDHHVESSRRGFSRQWINTHPFGYQVGMGRSSARGLVGLVEQHKPPRRDRAVSTTPTDRVGASWSSPRGPDSPRGGPGLSHAAELWARLRGQELQEAQQSQWSARSARRGQGGRPTPAQAAARRLTPSPFTGGNKPLDRRRSSARKSA